MSGQHMQRRIMRKDIERIVKTDVSPLGKMTEIHRIIKSERKDFSTKQIKDAITVPPIGDYKILL